MEEPAGESSYHPIILIQLGKSNKNTYTLTINTIPTKTKDLI